MSIFLFFLQNNECSSDAQEEMSITLWMKNQKMYAKKLIFVLLVNTQTTNKNQNSVEMSPEVIYSFFILQKMFTSFFICC